MNQQNTTPTTPSTTSGTTWLRGGKRIAASVDGVGVKSVYAAADAGALRVARVGRTIISCDRWVAEWLEKLASGGAK